MNVHPSDLEDLIVIPTVMDQAPPVVTSGVTFTVRAAADACAVHANTVRRRLKTGDFPNAYRDHAGTWKIPVSDLEAAGLRPHRTRVEPPAPVAVAASMSGLPSLRETYEALQVLEDEADALRERVATLTVRADLAEALASERAGRIDDLRVALRALEAVNQRPEDRAAAYAAATGRALPEAQAAAPAPAPAPAPAIEPTPGGRRGLFRRNR